MIKDGQLALSPSLADRRLMEAGEEIYGSEPENLKYLHV
jgi:hypothetical protein